MGNDGDGEFPRSSRPSNECAELTGRRAEAWLFCKSGNPLVAAPLTHREGEPVAIPGKAWATACRTAGVPEKQFHDLCAARLPGTWCAPVFRNERSRWTGRVTRSMFDRYNIVSEDDLRMAAQKTTTYVDTLPITRDPA